MPKINSLLNPIFGSDVFSVRENSFGFKNIQQQLIFSKFEGQIDTGKMMSSLLHKVQAAGVKILNSINVNEFIEAGASVEVKTDEL